LLQCCALCRKAIALVSFGQWLRSCFAEYRLLQLANSPFKSYLENKKTPSSVKGRRSCSRYHLYPQVKKNLALKFDNGFHIRSPLLEFHGNCSEVTFKCLFMKAFHQAAFSLKCTHILLSSSTH